MARQVLVVALLLGLAAFAVLAPATAKPAAACSFALATLDEMAELAEIVIVGEVVTEHPVGPDVYRSTISVSATLKGNPEREFTLDQLGLLLGDCSGGPRLAAGERVLLFLSNWGGRVQVNAYEQGKYVLSEGEAKTLSNPAMSADDALRRVAAITNAPPDELDAALAFVRDEPPPTSESQPAANVSEDERSQPLPNAAEEDDGTSARLIGVAAAGALVLLAALLFAARRLRRAS